MRRAEYLTKHTNYIKYRLDMLSDHIGIDNSISSCEIRNKLSLPDMISVLTGEAPVPENIRPDARDALTDLKTLTERWDILSDGDILGYIYQRLQSSSQKKSRGQYFTPRDVVDYLVTNAISGDNSLSAFRILDPACGSGQFLIAAYVRLHHLYIKSGTPPDQAAAQIISQNLFGIDRDPAAARICRYNLMRISGQCLKNIKVYNNNFISSNESSEPSRLSRISFTHIIGNPPWGSALTRAEKCRIRSAFASAHSGINTFTLFIEQGINLLSDGGCLAYLVPEAYLNIKAHSSSRQFLLDHARIQEIALWGEKFHGVFAPSVSFIAQRESRAENRSRSIIRVHRPAPGADGKTVTLIPQTHFSTTPQHIFNVHYTRRAVSLISRIEEQDCIYLKNRARFFLGIVTGSNPAHIRKHFSAGHPDPILLGKDVSQYRIEFSGHYFRYDPGSLQQVAAKELYLARNKLLYKFIGKKLIFALDREGLYSLNNINGFIPVGGDMEPECLMALLNSRVIQYYYETNFFTIKVLRGNLEQLPLKKLSRDGRSTLKALTTELMESGRSASGPSIRENIEDIIFHEYGIKDREAYMISDSGNGDFTAGATAEEAVQIQ